MRLARPGAVRAVDRTGARDNVSGMLERVVRIMLAIATAIVISAQVEAAAQHCARLAHETVEPVKAKTSSCHDTVAAAMEARQAGAADKGAHHQAPHKQSAPDRCECIAVLSACPSVVTPAGSSRIEPYAWAEPGAEGFATTEPAPALRPPRA